MGWKTAYHRALWRLALQQRRQSCLIAGKSAQVRRIRMLSRRSVPMSYSYMTEETDNNYPAFGLKSEKSPWLAEDCVTGMT
jgi:hypothetical protein